MAESTQPKTIAYPDGLEKRELAIWKQRGETIRGFPKVGFALSGGGIRSATFCLGVFQALAKKPGLLRKIDFISSVSGGSFFASFYGRLFSRKDIDGPIIPPKAPEEPSDVEKILSPDSALRLSFPAEAEKWKEGVFNWLRENGRYLAPNGSGDLLLATALFLRNWITVQLLVAMSLFAVFLASGLIRCELPTIPMPETSHLWLSPYLILAGAMALFGVVPLGWSYWSFSLREPDTSIPGEFSVRSRMLSAIQFGLRGLIVLGCLGLVLLAVARIIQYQTNRWNQYLQPIGLVVLELTFVAWQFGRLRGSLSRSSIRLSLARSLLLALVVVASILLPRLWTQPQCRELASAGVAVLLALAFAFWLITAADNRSELLNQSEKARAVVTKYLRTALFATFGILGFALVDSLGQTLYLLSFRANLLAILAALFGAISTMVPFAQSASALLGPKKKVRPTISIRLLAGLGAALVILPFVVSIDAFSHAIAYNFKLPTEAPTALIASTKIVPETIVLEGQPSSLSLDVTIKKKLEANSTAASESPPSGSRSLSSVSLFFVIAALFSVLAGGGSRGSSWIFVNRTSLHALYAARLIRAYLGASNRDRYGSKVPGVSDPVDGDDIAQEDYWRPDDDGFWKKGAPLHLINVTINETIDGRSQTEQRDRGGVGMAIGPAGISVGVKHHVVFNPTSADTTEATPYKIYPEAGAGEFRVFAPDEGGDAFAGQKLSLGNWTAISGAAVSTGLGSLNSLGASLLTGFFNLRLGYWWDSGTRSITKGANISRVIGKWMAKLLPAQSALIDEFQGRFRGTMRRYWYLTDGGHFENLGAYELIRRRLPVMVVIDAGGDPEYNFQDLANLVRKARLDFNAEIRFLNPKEDNTIKKATGRVGELFHEVDPQLLGTLDQLRRGKWAEEPVEERQPFFESVNRDGLSLRHAALAKVTYLDDPNYDAYLLLIKPTLIGEEPQDLTNYHLAHPSFPHETTADQFFDEAQWESYRRLGQHIAEKVFKLPQP